MIKKDTLAKLPKHHEKRGGLIGDDISGQRHILAKPKHHERQALRVLLC